jgi:hypothetical protein
LGSLVIPPSSEGINIVLAGDPAGKRIVFVIHDDRAIWPDSGDAKPRGLRRKDRPLEPRSCEWQRLGHFPAKNTMCLLVKLETGICFGTVSVCGETVQ